MSQQCALAAKAGLHWEERGTGACFLWGEARTAETVQPGGEKAQGSSYWCVKVTWMGRMKKTETGFQYSVVPTGRTGGTRHKLKPRRFPLNIWQVFHCEDGQALVSQTDGGVSTLQSWAACSSWPWLSLTMDQMIRRSLPASAVLLFTHQRKPLCQTCPSVLSGKWKVWRTHSIKVMEWLNVMCRSCPKYMELRHVECEAVVLRT